MNANTARRLLLGLTAAALLGAAGGYVAIAGGEDGSTEASPAQNPAKARAIGARWRAERTPALATEYAHALIAAGLYDELLTEIAERGLFAREPAAATLYRTEAALRQGRYESAIETARPGGAFDPYLAFARARAAYALTGDRADAEADLMAALRGPKALEAQAWLFRARLALDENDLADAEAAARRAFEAGAGRGDTAKIEIEAALRGGDPVILETQEKSKRRGLFGAGQAPRQDSALLRVAAMAKLKDGDARAAVRLIEEAPQTGDDRARLLAALAKWMNGDAAQAYALTSVSLASAPNDWIALDLAAAIARDLGRTEESDALLQRLAARRPELAALRRLAIDGDNDAARAALVAARAATRGGAAFALLGGDVNLPKAIAEPSSEAFAAADLAGAIGGGDVSVIRKSLRRLQTATSPLALAVVGDAYGRLGDNDRAVEFYARAAVADPGFFVPVDRAAQLYASSGRLPAALDLIRDFEARSPGDDKARLSLAVLEAKIGATGASARSFADVPAALIFAEEETALLYAGVARAEGGATLASMLDAAEKAAPPITLGKIRLALGDHEAAALQFRKALIADPMSSAAPALYQSSMRKLGRDDEAASLLAALVARRPDAESAAAALASTEKGGGTGE